MTQRRSIKSHRAAGIAVSLLLVVTGCAAPDSFDEPSVALETAALVGAIHQGQPWHDSASMPVGIAVRAAPAGAHLTYYGGRVVSNVQVVQVLYGSGSYHSQVASTTSPSLATFYQGVLNSPYVDWLSEYNTTTQSGTRTNQVIGRGSFLSQVSITPSSANNGAAITDAQVQAELAAQITAGQLPAPMQDAAGNNNTYYAVFFPHGKTLSMGGSNSCQAGGFCAYHGTISSVGGKEIYYGVHPDMQAGSGCEAGCGSAATAFSNYTSVASHELIETVTDAEVGLATTFAPPLAWYDGVNGEIGDICNAQQGTIVGSDGLTYTVQTEFSNVAGNCIVSRPVADDFSLSASPASLTVTAGTPVTSTITTATVSGNAQSIALSVSGLPTGVTASFSPSAITSGSSATLTVSADSTAAAGTFSLTVSGAALSGSHSATIQVAVNVPVADDFSLSASPASLTVTAGTPVTSTITTATVSGNTQSIALSVSGLPTGVTASFSPSAIASGSSATLTVSADSTAAAGTFSLAVSGAALSGSHSATIQVTVNVPVANDFSLSANPASLTVTRGASVASTITTATVSGTAQSIALSVSGLPTGVTASFSPSAITSGSPATLTVSADSTAAAGAFSLTVSGSALSGSHSATVQVMVDVPVANDFSLSASPANLTVKKGTSVTSTITTATLSGSAQSIVLSSAGAPAGVSVSFSPSSIASGLSSTLTVTASSTVAPCTFSLSVTGVAASGSHSTTIQVSVTAPAANDFSIAVSPSSLTIKRERSSSVTISSSVTSGRAQTIAWSASGLPSGVTASFKPGFVTSGVASTLKLSVGSKARAGTWTITITGTGTSGSHSISLRLTIPRED